MANDSDFISQPQSVAPWLSKKEWASGKINFSIGENAALAVVLAVIVNLMSVLAWLAVQDEVFGKGNWWALLCLLVPALGLVLLFVAIACVRRWRKFGQSVFEMASVPGVIGGQLTGVIRTSAKIHAEDGFHLALHCVRSVTHGDTTDAIVWQDEQIICRDLLQNDPDQTAIPVLFQIPYDCRPTDDTSEWGQTAWQLVASARTFGLTYRATFDVPVFQTAESDPNFVVDRSLIAGYRAPETPDRDLHQAGVVKMPSPTGEGCRLVFPMARAPVMATIIALAGFFFAGVPFWVCYTAGRRHFLFAKVASIVLFGGFGLLLLGVSADMWFYRSVIDASVHGLTVTGGWFGLGRPQRIETRDIEKIVPISRMGSGGGTGQKMYYDIDIVRTTGKRVAAGKRVPGKRLAESVIRQIEQAIGKSPATARD